MNGQHDHPRETQSSPFRKSWIEPSTVLSCAVKLFVQFEEDVMCSARVCEHNSIRVGRHWPPVCVAFFDPTFSDQSIQNRNQIGMRSGFVATHHPDGVFLGPATLASSFRRAKRGAFSECGNSMAGSGGAGAVLAGFVLPFNRAMIRSKFIGRHHPTGGPKQGRRDGVATSAPDAAQDKFAGTCGNRASWFSQRPIGAMRVATRTTASHASSTEHHAPAPVPARIAAP